MLELRWYLEQFLDYPFDPETHRSERVLAALKEWGKQAFDALFNFRDAGNWLRSSNSMQIRSDHPRILSWPWEALYDNQAGAFIGHHRRVERRLNQLADPPALPALPIDRVNVLLVVARPYENDVRYRSIARPLVEMIRSSKSPAHVDILRPPTFDNLRECLRRRPNYYHVLHFDGHGAYGEGTTHKSLHQFRGHQGRIIFETENGEPDPKLASDLSALLREYCVPAVVLNACQSAKLDDQAQDAFATVATALLQSGMRSVVAMAYSLYVSGAQVFLPFFYRRLFESGSVAEGVRAGRQQMLSNQNRVSARGLYPLQDWLLPVLYQQDPLDFRFATQAKVEARSSHLPKEVLEHREEYGFIGRDGPILEMERALHRSSSCILIRGLGGVGKTTLARGFLRWLDETGGLDASLWFDFRDIRTAEYVMNQTGELFYGENFRVAPNKLDLLVQAFRKSRVLVVWDNFESVGENLPTQDRTELSHFLDAIRGTQARVIITSRSSEEWLGSPRRFELRLGGLDGEERWQYCTAIIRELGLKINQNDPDLKRLMDQLAGHPLAMRTVLPKLETMPAANITEALRRNLAALGLSEQEEQGSLFATLRLIEHGLPGELQLLVAFVASHEGYLDADALELMAKQVNPAWARSEIDQLVGTFQTAGLLWSYRRATYEMHPLLTSYLRSNEEPSEAFQRAFVDLMSGAADFWVRKPYHDQLIPFTLHGANFHQALRISEKLRMNVDFAVLNGALATYALNSRNFMEASRLFLRQAKYGAAVNNDGTLAVANHQLGIIATELRDFGAAQEWYLKSLALERQDSPIRAATIYHQLGRVAQEQRQFTTANDWYLKSLILKEQNGDAEGCAMTYHQLGRVAEEQRQFDSAREWYLKCLAIYEQKGDLHGASSAYHQLGVVAHEQSNFEAARKLYLKSLVISEKHRNLHGSSISYHQLGRLEEDQGNFENSREWYLKSLAISEKQGNLHNAAGTYGQLGTLAGKQGNLQDSGRWLIRAIATFRQTQDAHRVEGNFENFLITYENCSDDDKRRLEAIWREANLGQLPLQKN
jgi:tetratricopeptide (TPR) repeat protein